MEKDINGISFRIVGYRKPKLGECYLVEVKREVLTASHDFLLRRHIVEVGEPFPFIDKKVRYGIGKYSYRS